MKFENFEPGQLVQMAEEITGETVQGTVLNVDPSERSVTIKWEDINTDTIHFQDENEFPLMSKVIP